LSDYSRGFFDSQVWADSPESALPPRFIIIGSVQVCFVRQAHSADPSVPGRIHSVQISPLTPLSLANVHSFAGLHIYGGAVSHKSRRRLIEGARSCGLWFTPAPSLFSDDTPVRQLQVLLRVLNTPALQAIESLRARTLQSKARYFDITE
jgi:hypothetical protein